MKKVTMQYVLDAVDANKRIHLHGGWSLIFQCGGAGLIRSKTTVIDIFKDPDLKGSVSIETHGVDFNDGLFGITLDEPTFKLMDGDLRLEGKHMIIDITPFHNPFDLEYDFSFSCYDDNRAAGNFVVKKGHVSNCKRKINRAFLAKVFKK